jgi:hypothetical protein
MKIIDSNNKIEVRYFKKDTLRMIDIQEMIDKIDKIEIIETKEYYLRAKIKSVSLPNLILEEIDPLLNRQIYNLRNRLDIKMIERRIHQRIFRL